MNLDSIKRRTASKLSEWVQKRIPYEADNMFLEGAFAPVRVESTYTELRVTGSIPAALNGLLARNGSNPIHVTNPATYHWFSGDGMVHGLRLEGGKALWYRNRYVGADRANRLLGRPLLPGTRHGVVDVVNTNIIGHAGRLWALVEAGASPIELDAELNSIRHGLFDANRPAPFTAHPHRDPVTGNLHAVSYDALNRSQVFYQVIDPAGQLAHMAPIPVKHGPMMHDCAITDRHVILLDMPVTFSFGTLLKGGTLPYAWNPKHPARIGILPHFGNHTQLRWLKVEPCFVFHTGNARELPNGDIRMDVVVHGRMFDRSIQGPEAQQVTLERWTLPVGSDTVKREVISERRQEFPRYDERRTGKDYRYLYTVGADPANPASAQPLFCHDLESGTCAAHHYSPGRITGEVVFVPRHDEGSEKDGWLLSFVYDTGNDRCDVVILNADDVAGEPQAVIHLPVRVPLGFHCNWIPLPAGQ